MTSYILQISTVKNWYDKIGLNLSTNRCHELQTQQYDNYYVSPGRYYHGVSDFTTADQSFKLSSEQHKVSYHIEWHKDNDN